MNIILRNSEPTRARQVAVDILNKYSQSCQTLDKIIDVNSNKINTLSRKDKSLLNHLVYGVIRWREKLDWITTSLSKRPIYSISPNVLNIIRIGLYQILFMDRIPQSAAVNTSVNLVKTNKSFKKAVGYVNAILRTAIRKQNLMNIPHSIEKTKHLAIVKSFPKWILTRWVNRFGYTKTCNMCDSLNTIPHIIIRVNILKCSKNNLKTLLSQEAEIIKTFSLLPNSLSISKIKQPIYEMKTFLKGFFSVQDGAAQISTHILSPNPGETVLDACAGLGSKSTHMAQIMNNRGQIIAVDNIKPKLDKLTTDANRLGVKIIETQQMDLNFKIKSKYYSFFDRIMLDAPCSGLGVIRRNPDTKWSSSIKHIINCSKKQLRLLETVSLLLKPKGILVYVVCSIEPEENEDVIKTFLTKHKNYKIKHKNTSKNEWLNMYRGKDGFFRTYPHIHNMDSFFIALLERNY